MSIFRKLLADKNLHVFARFVAECGAHGHHAADIAVMVGTMHDDVIGQSEGSVVVTVSAKREAQINQGMSIRALFAWFPTYSKLMRFSCVNWSVRATA